MNKQSPKRLPTLGYNTPLTTIDLIMDWLTLAGIVVFCIVFMLF